MCLNNVRQSVETDSNAFFNLSALLDCDLDMYDVCKVSDVCNVVKEGDLNILHLNIRSLHKNIDSLRELIDALTRKGIILDAILLCETWINNSNSSLLEISGYNLLLNNRKTSVGGGIGIYVRNCLKPKLKLNLSPNREGVFESMLVEVTVKKTKMYFGEFYRVPGTQQHLFDDSFSELVKNCGNVPTILGSDQNLDLIKFSRHKMTDKFLNSILNNGMLPTILKPTRVTHTSSTLIDNVFIPVKYLDSFKSYVILNFMSDHFPCLVQIRTNTDDVQSCRRIKSRKITDSTLLNINNDLLHVDWLKLLNKSDDVNVNYESFVRLVHQSLDTHAPMQEKLIAPRNVIHTPWMTPELLKNSKKCKRLYRESIHDPDCKKKKSRYREYARTLRKLKSTAKSAYYQKEILSYNGNCKKIWTLLNTLMRRNNDKTNIISELRTQDGVTSDPLKICSELNAHFASAGERVSHDPGTKDYLKYLGARSNNNFNFSVLTEEQVIKLIERLPNKTSCGVDGINNVLVKQIKYSIRLPLCILINQSLGTGTFPNTMKIAKVIALFKKGDTLLSDNYRPISLLSVISKILERAVNNQLYSYFIDNEILTDSQYGFRKNHSTVHAVQHLIGDIISGFDKKFLTLAVFIDLRKCFDSCRHHIIIDKLEHYGVRGTSLKWFISYLSGRTQFVQYNKEIKSDLSSVTIGTPQGSILGPILTLVMLNDMRRSLKLSHSILFADDTTIYVQGTNVEFLFVKMQRELDLIRQWLLDNGLSLNIDKTKCMLFHPKGTTYVNNKSLTLDKKPIEQVDNFKLLGLNVDPYLSFEPHVIDLNHKINQFKFIMRKLSIILPIHCLRNIYFAFVHSRITYGIGCWGSLIDERLACLLEKQQKSIVRIMNKKSPLVHSSPLFLNSKILKLKNVIELEFILLIYKYRHQELPRSLSRFFVVKEHNYNTRNQNTPIVRKHKCNLFNKSFLNQAVQTWEKYKHLFEENVSTKASVKRTFKYHCFAQY